jgi:endonuclease YncB( thermonuclease family)
MRRIYAIAFLALFCLSLQAHAHTLQVLVVEVQDGKTLIVENTNRRFKVILKAADAPELDQPAGDVARQHLADLVLNKPVAVEITGMVNGSHVIARVFTTECDISLQMIRDGVAWYDRSYEKELSEAERRLYAESEQAARSEHRGIWEDPQPVSPWEWRQAKAEAAQQYRVPPMKTRAPALPPPAPAASNPPAASREDSKWKWPLLTPPGAPFALRIPGGGRQYSISVQLPQGQTVTANYYWTQHLKVGYIAMWASGPAHTQMISELFERTQNYLNQAAAARGLPCEFTRKSDANFNGYTGQRYVMQGCYFHGGMRLYYKVEGKILTIYMVGIQSEEPDDPTIDQFLESFVINEKAKD